MTCHGPGGRSNFLGSCEPQAYVADRLRYETSMILSASGGHLGSLKQGYLQHTALSAIGCIRDGCLRTRASQGRPSDAGAVNPLYQRRPWCGGWAVVAALAAAAKPGASRCGRWQRQRGTPGGAVPCVPATVAGHRQGTRTIVMTCHSGLCFAGQQRQGPVLARAGRPRL